MLASTIVRPPSYNTVAKHAGTIQPIPTMTQHQRILNDLEIENARVADLLYDDFNAYQENFDAAGEDSAHDDLRTSFLGWTMTFAPEVFPQDLAVEIARFVKSAEGRGDYLHYGWHNTLHLRAGLFALTRDKEWLEHGLGNSSHHNSSLRRYVARTLAPVIHLVNCRDLEPFMDVNLEKWHFFNVYLLTLYIAAIGDAAYKRKRITSWAEQYPDGNDSKLFASILSGEPMENVFLPQLRRVERYVLLRLCSRPHEVPIQRVAAWGEPASGSGLRRDPDTRIDADVILDRIETHPLMDGFVNTLPTGIS